MISKLLHSSSCSRCSAFLLRLFRRLYTLGHWLCNTNFFRIPVTIILWHLRRFHRFVTPYTSLRESPTGRNLQSQTETRAPKKCNLESLQAPLLPSTVPETIFLQPTQSDGSGVSSHDLSVPCPEVVTGAENETKANPPHPSNSHVTLEIVNADNLPALAVNETSAPLSIIGPLFYPIAPQDFERYVSGTYSV